MDRICDDFNAKQRTRPPTPDEKYEFGFRANNFAFLPLRKDNFQHFE